MVLSESGIDEKPLGDCYNPECWTLPPGLLTGRAGAGPEDFFTFILVASGTTLGKLPDFNLIIHHVSLY